MANEFELVENNGLGRKCIWKCNTCGLEIRSATKPQSHFCGQSAASPSFLQNTPFRLSPGADRMDRPSPFLNTQQQQNEYHTPPYIPFTPHLPSPNFTQ